MRRTLIQTQFHRKQKQGKLGRMKRGEDIVCKIILKLLNQ